MKIAHLFTWSLLVFLAVSLEPVPASGGPIVEPSWQATRNTYDGNFSGSRAYSSSSYLRIGNTGGTPSYASSVGEVWFNVGELEIDAIGGVYVNASSGMLVYDLAGESNILLGLGSQASFLHSEYGTSGNGGFRISPGTDHGRHVIIGAAANNQNDYLHGAATGSEVPLYIHSSTAAATSTNEYLKLVHDGTNGVISTGTGSVVMASQVAYGTQAITPSGAATLTPTKSFVTCSCSAGGGCAITMGESGITSGQIVTIVNIGTNVCSFADTSGVSELAGAFSAGQYDQIRMIYVTDRWLEVGRSNN